MGNSEQRAQEKGKYELKEFVARDRVKEVLKKWLGALEDDQDFEIDIKGKHCRVPKEVFQVEKTKLEFEVKDGEYELELQLKWRNPENRLLIQ